MTWNIYFGAEVTLLINKTPVQIPEVVAKIFKQFEQTDFLARAKAIAKQICRAEPDLIGLQEVALWTVQSPTTKKSSINFLNILLKELKLLDLEYYVVTVNRNFGNRLRSSKGDIIGLWDQDVILARCKTPLIFSNIQEKIFCTNLIVTIGNYHVKILRGWSSVDICMYDKKFRLVNTHLESESDQVRFAQAYELLKGPGATNLPVVFIGDFNSNADEKRSAPTYDMLIDAGYTDAWDIAGRGLGYTGFQASNLLNPVSTLRERVDLILFRDGFKVIKVDTVGDKQRDRTGYGLWPSDHAGVVATCIFKDNYRCL